MSENIKQDFFIFDKDGTLVTAICETEAYTKDYCKKMGYHYKKLSIGNVVALQSKVKALEEEVDHLKDCIVGYVLGNPTAIIDLLAERVISYDLDFNEIKSEYQDKVREELKKAGYDFLAPY